MTENKHFIQRSCLFRGFAWLLAAVILAGLLLLGQWQLTRGAEKQAIATAVLLMEQQQFDINQQAVMLPQRYAQAMAEGRYWAEQTFFLDNQVFNGQVGYHVITPFELKSGGGIILVNRGWVPVGPSRVQKPLIHTPAGELSILGRLNLPPSQPVFWNDSHLVVQDQAWQYLDLAEYTQRTGIVVAPLLLELDKTLDQVGGYVRQWRSYDDHWVNRHRAYAAQWFSMAGVFFILCVFLWYRTKRANRSVV